MQGVDAECRAGTQCQAVACSPQHQGLVDRITELESVVANSEIVLQAKRLQDHPIPHREGQPQLVTGAAACRQAAW